MTPPTPLDLTIPSGIHALPGLNLSERVALAHVAKFPGCSNASLGTLLGISVRGAENLLRRLRARALIRQEGQGRAREHVLTFPVAHHTPCGISENVESHTDCVVDPSAQGVAQPEISTADFVANHLCYCENCFEVGNHEAARHHLELARNRLEPDDGIPPEVKAKYVIALKLSEARLFAFRVGAEMADGLPASDQRNLARTLGRASSEKLTLFRECVEAAASLNDAKGALGLLSG